MLITKRKDVNGLHYDTTARKPETPPRYAYGNFIYTFERIRICANSTGGQMKNINLKPEN
jgi:hypothetical protein